MYQRKLITMGSSSSKVKKTPDHSETDIYIKAIEAIEPASKLRDLGCKLVEMILPELVKRNLKPDKISINYEQEANRQYFQIRTNMEKKIHSLKIVEGEEKGTYYVTNSIDYALGPEASLSASTGSNMEITDDNQQLTRICDSFMVWFI